MPLHAEAAREAKPVAAGVAVPSPSDHPVSPNKTSAPKIAVSGMNFYYGAHRVLGVLWLAQGERDRALDHFARTCELRRGEDRAGIAAASLRRATRGKLLHDAGQFGYLAARRRDGQRRRPPRA